MTAAARFVRSLAFSGAVALCSTPAVAADGGFPLPDVDFTVAHVPYVPSVTVVLPPALLTHSVDIVNEAEEKAEEAERAAADERRRRKEQEQLEAAAAAAKQERQAELRRQHLASIMQRAGSIWSKPRRTPPLTARPTTSSPPTAARSTAS